jgi:hypothetical protein
MAKMFQEETLEEENNLIDIDLQAAWKAWISAEERKRYFSSLSVGQRCRLTEHHTGSS